LELQGADPVGVEHRKDDGAQKNDDQAGKGEIFDQTKRLDAFRDARGFHRAFTAAIKAGSAADGAMDVFLGWLVSA
jgi:hypothetical protein